MSVRRPEKHVAEIVLDRAEARNVLSTARAEWHIGELNPHV